MDYAYQDMTDKQLVCAWKHGWTAKSYLGHGISDRADASRKRLQAELNRRGIEVGSWFADMNWGQHTDECPPPTERPAS